MAKDTYYFSHDYNPMSDPKMSALVGEFGAAGYGVFWRIIEILHEDESHVIQKKPYVFASIAKQMLTDVEQVLNIIKYATEVCELFCEDENVFWSERVFRNIDHRNGIREKRSVAGKASAAARLQQVSTSVQQKSTKERKGNKSKLKEIPPLPFSSKDFVDTWTLFVVERGTGKKKVTPTSAKLMFDEFTEWGEAVSIQAIKKSIKNGWQGVFKPDQHIQTNGHQTEPPRTFAKLTADD